MENIPNEMIKEALEKHSTILLSDECKTLVDCFRIDKAVNMIGFWYDDLSRSNHTVWRKL